MKIQCTKCKGYGKIPDLAERVFTLGISYIIEKLEGTRVGWNTCPNCNGKGSLTI